MLVTPPPNEPLRPEDASPANPVPLRRGAEGELILIALTPAVAQLARVAQAMAAERCKRRPRAPAGPETRQNPPRAKKPATFIAAAGLPQTKVDRMRTLVR
jgi:hypothetical protein